MSYGATKEYQKWWEEIVKARNEGKPVDTKALKKPST
jgi:hypothetical protein